MLRDLHIQNLALIEDLWLDFGPGLTVLTGETGAGKTVLLSALELIMGGRGDSSQIAAGQTRAKVEASFDVPSEPFEITVSRSMTSAGRTRLLLDGDLSSVSALQRTIGSMIDLHGQHDHQALLSASRHIEYLDRWAANEIAPLQESYDSARKQWQTANKELQTVLQLIERSINQHESGRIALADIAEVDPQPGEDDHLRELLPVLRNSEDIAELASAAQNALRSDGAALEQLYNLDNILEQLTAFMPVATDLRAQATDARLVFEGIADAIAEYAANISHDPQAIEVAFQRLSVLENLAKRYGPTLDAVLRRKADLSEMLSIVDNSDERLFDARDAERLARTQLQESAAKLSAARHSAARDFVADLAAAANDLELGKVRFEVDFTSLDFDQWTAAGSEQVQILYAPAPAVPPRPLAKIASGGEISRVMLALKSVLGDADNINILVFDEVDAGIGGATGLAIGAKLKKLAVSHQVIVVTHLAQVAAYADAHFRVSKMENAKNSNQVNTQVSALTVEERVHELARMLSGSDSATAIKHAKELLQTATNRV